LSIWSDIKNIRGSEPLSASSLVWACGWLSNTARRGPASVFRQILAHGSITWARARGSRSKPDEKRLRDSKIPARNGLRERRAPASTNTRRRSADRVRDCCGRFRQVLACGSIAWACARGSRSKPDEKRLRGSKIRLGSHLQCVWFDGPASVSAAPEMPAAARAASAAVR
jgi:hypothetical protein